MVGTFDKVALITGGTLGIGKGCARAFVKAGATVVICARGRERGEAVAAELSAQGPGRCHFEPCDVTRPEELKRTIDRAVELFGRLDCLVNNAGWHPDHRPIDGFSVEEFESLLRMNVISCFVGCKYALPHLRRSRGSIINISSLVGTMGQEWAVTYVATKGAVTAMSKALAVDEARNGVRINAVLPGAVETPLLRSFLENADNPQQKRDIVDSYQWLGRPASEDEVGEVCLFLASDQASFVTGVEMIVSGGAELAYGMKWPKSGSISL